MHYCMPITCIHVYIHKCCVISVLNLENCEALHTPPREIREQGMRTVISYVKRLTQGSAACYRTKLMFVGLGGAGKTRCKQTLGLKLSLSLMSQTIGVVPLGIPNYSKT